MCSGHYGGNGLLRKPFWCHSDGADQTPEEKGGYIRTERMRRDGEGVAGKKKRRNRGKKRKEKIDSRLIT